VLLSYIARFLSAAVSVYMILCFLRVVSSWLPGVDLGRGGRILESAVDPYLGFFSRMPALRGPRFDFSPIVALAVLSALNDLLSVLAFTGHISLGFVLALVLRTAWSALAFFLNFLAVFALVRIIAYAARWPSVHPLWMIVDSMLNPVLYRINRLVYRDRIVNYLQGLVTGFAVIVLGRVLVGAFVNFLGRLLERLPI
jgi:YggT family protein